MSALAYAIATAAPLHLLAVGFFFGVLACSVVTGVLDFIIWKRSA